MALQPAKRKLRKGTVVVARKGLLALPRVIPKGTRGKIIKVNDYVFGDLWYVVKFTWTDKQGREHEKIKTVSPKDIRK